MSFKHEKDGPFLQWLGEHDQLDGWGPVNPKYKFIFIHIPKTAGVSIASNLDMNCLQCHSSTRDIRKELNKSDFGKKIWQEYFKFSFVRNPWSWVISNIYYHACCFNTKIKVNSFLNEWMTKGKIKVVDNFTYHISNILEAGQYQFLIDFRSSEDKILVDFIGKFENLQKDFDYICDKINIDKRKITHENKTKSYGCYTEYYNEQTKNFIAEKYAKEIKFFGYEFENKNI